MVVGSISIGRLLIIHVMKRSIFRSNSSRSTLLDDPDGDSETAARAISRFKSAVRKTWDLIEAKTSESDQVFFSQTSLALNLATLN
ncbi:hypothetical protein Tco_0956915 [Tanacetum coccineum]